MLKNEYQAADFTLPYFYFPHLNAGNLVQNLFTTRHGGVSAGEFATLNLSFSRGDDEAAVLENYRRVAKAMGGTIDDIVCTDQTHTANVRVVTKEDHGKGITRKRDYQDVDGLVTNEPGIILAAFFADCVPVCIVDPVHKAVGLAHSGWRGTVAFMGQALLDKMQKTYGSRPEECLAAIGPSICRECYEVGGEVAEEFLRAFHQEAAASKEEAEQQKSLVYQNANGKFQLDLWRANELVLLQAGILPEHLSVTDICTCCQPTLLFSHRASHGRRGNLGMFVKLN